jgi:tetratricopeptide (TPR) repeat protein
MEHNLTHDSYYANINRINRFLTRNEEYGYGFAIAEHAVIIPNINKQLIEKAAASGHLVRSVFIDPQSDSPFVQQLRNAISMSPVADALIINNLGVLLPQQGNELTEDAKTFLLGLNFSREAIHKLKVPILFWLTRLELSGIGMLATDFFSQRQISNVYFHDSPDIFAPDLTLEKHLIAEENTEEDYQRLLLKINLLKKQLKEAVENHYPIERARIDIALPLVKAYDDSKMYKEAVEIMDEYFYPAIYDDRSIMLECARIYYDAGEEQKAQDIYLALIDLSKSANQEDIILCFAYSGLAVTYLSEENTSKTAFDYYEKAILLSEQLYESDPESETLIRGLSDIYISIASSYQIKEEYNKAADYYLKGLELSEELHIINPESDEIKQLLANLYENVGDFYLIRFLPKEALDFYLECLPLREELLAVNYHSTKQKSLLARCYLSIGRVYYKLHEKQALDYLTEALQLTKELYKELPSSEKTKHNLATTYLTLADYYQSQNNLKKMQEYYKKVVELNK